MSSPAASTCLMVTRLDVGESLAVPTVRASSLSAERSVCSASYLMFQWSAMSRMVSS